MNLKLTPKEAETVMSALIFYQRELIDADCYDNLTTHQRVAERASISRVESKLMSQWGKT